MRGRVGKTAPGLGVCSGERLSVSTAPADVPHLKRPAPPLRPSRRTIIPEWG